MAQIFAIGASQGGVQVLRTIVAALPSDFPAPILVVIHTGQDSQLPSVLADAGKLPATHAIHGESYGPGHIYIAPPDRHMLVVDGRLELSHGPRENWARPAIDPLFRSVAETFGPEAAGLVLTGRLNDGTSGLYEIKRRGGVALVQDPATAEAPGMPGSAIDNVPVDYCLSVPDIPAMLIQLAKKKAVHQTISMQGGVNLMSRDAVETRPSAQTCPECGGAMVEELQGTLSRFRCHTGHAMTAEVLAATQLETLEHDLAAVLRFLAERAELCRSMAKRHRERGNVQTAELWERAEMEARSREEPIRNLNRSEWIHPEAVERG